MYCLPLIRRTGIPIVAEANLLFLDTPAGVVGFSYNPTPTPPRISRYRAMGEDW